MSGSTHFPPQACCPTGQAWTQAPRTQTWVPPQIAPPVQSGLAPQRFRSVAGSTQRPPQTMSDPRHTAAAEPHTPPEQTSPPWHTVPPLQSAAAPQCAGSLRGSTHLPPQTANPTGQLGAQVPEAQTSPAAQATPSAQVVAPQRVGSDEGSTQVPSQASSPGGQDGTQTPAEQVDPQVHSLPPVQSGWMPHSHESASGS